MSGSGARDVFDPGWLVHGYGHFDVALDHVAGKIYWQLEANLSQ